MTPSIFISYRRSDSNYEAREIHERLSAVFGLDQVFLDTDDNIAGENYVKTQIEFASSAKVTLVIIGKGWMNARDAEGRRRLDNEKDLVRREIEAALNTQGVVTMPVFIASGTGFTEEHLPVSMQNLARIHGPHIRFGQDFNQDMIDLIDDLKNYVIPQSPPITRSADGRDDIKNVIVDHKTSVELIRGTPPSFVQCVETTRTCTLTFEDKSRPVDKFFRYNHFWGPSVILYTASARSSIPKLLWYQRVRRPGEPTNLIRGGPSILIHASFTFNVTREISVMDNWISQAHREGAKALDTFVKVPDGVLFKLLDYKIALSGIQGECKPFAVITRDLRAQENRVYTQYVFVMTMRSIDKKNANNVSALLSRVVMQNDGQLQLAPPNLNPEFFLREDNNRKILDYLALRGLLGKEESIEIEGGRFTRGFEIT